MFRLIKKISMGLLISIVNASNHTKFASLSNQKCMIQPTFNHLHLRDNTHMTSMKIVQFSRSPTPFVHLRPKFFHSLDLGCPISRNPPLQMIINQLKENTIQVWLLYVIRSFLRVGSHFQYQLNNPLNASVALI